MSINEQKGCVYFFKHIGLSPIKIGYSENESPINRFEQFKTYAPFGAELIGFIRTNEAKKLETELHKKYARDRIKGEWFEISKEDAEKCISFYSNIIDIEEMNSFQVNWAKSLSISSKLSNEDYFLIFTRYYSFIPKEGFTEVITNQKEICNLIDIEKKNLKEILFKNDVFAKTFRVDGIIKSGFKIYKNDLI